MLDQTKINCADLYPPSCCFDPCENGCEEPNQFHGDKSDENCVPSPCWQDIYCEQPLPLDKNHRIPPANGTGQADGDVNSAWQKTGRFASKATIQTPWLMLASDEGHAVADHESDNDAKSGGDININVHIDSLFGGGCALGDINNVEGDQTNDNDTSDVKQNANRGDADAKGPRGNGGESHGNGDTKK